MWWRREMIGGGIVAEEGSPFRQKGLPAQRILCEEQNSALYFVHQRKTTLLTGWKEGERGKMRRRIG